MQSPTSSAPCVEQRYVSPTNEIRGQSEEDNVEKEPSPLQQLERDLSNESLITQEGSVDSAALMHSGYNADTERTYEVTTHPVASRNRSHDSEDNPHNILSALLKHINLSINKEKDRGIESKPKYKSSI